MVSSFRSSVTELDKWTASLGKSAERVNMQSVSSKNDAARIASQVMASRRMQATDEGKAKKTAEDIFKELQLMDEQPSESSDYIHQMKDIPIKAKLPSQSSVAFNNLTSTSQTAPRPPKSPTNLMKSAISMAGGVAGSDTDFNEEYAKCKTMELILEYKEYRTVMEQKVSKYETETLNSNLEIAELRGRNTELSRQLKQQQMQHQVLDNNTENFEGRSNTFLKSKLKEVVAVHEVLQWQLHEKEKEQRVLEDIIKANLLIHPSHSQPLRSLLSKRLPQYLKRIENGLPILQEARLQGSDPIL